MSRAIRHIQTVGGIGIIPLTQGQVAIVDASDVHLVSGVNWYAVRRSDGRGFYAGRSVDGRIHFLHRTILGLTVDDADFPDHRDGDGLNNRRGNLRRATRLQNSSNRRSFKNRTGFKGVSLAVKTGLFVASIQVNRVQKQLGSYKTAIEAAMAYDAAAVAAHGEYAMTNKKLGRL